MITSYITHVFKKEFLHKILIFLSITALFISLFLVYEYSKPYDMSCIGNSTSGTSAPSSCQQVQDSEYSVLFGVSLPYIGSLFFIFLTFYLMLPFFVHKVAFNHNVFAPNAANSVYYRPTKSVRYNLGLFGLIFGAFVMELYFMYLQIVVISVVCSWCVVLSAVVFGMFFVYLVAQIHASKTTQ